MAQVQLTTDVKNYGYSRVQAAAFTIPVPTATQPTSETGHLVIGGNANYLKLQAYSQPTGNGKCRIYGWNMCRDLGGVWIPQLLYSDTTSVNSDQLTIPSFGSGQFRSRVFAAASGTNVNVKSISHVTGGVTGAMLIVDCLGAQFISIMVQQDTASDPVTNDIYHILHSSI